MRGAGAPKLGCHAILLVPVVGWKYVQNNHVIKNYFIWHIICSGPNMEWNAKESESYNFCKQSVPWLHELWTNDNW